MNEDISERGPVPVIEAGGEERRLGLLMPSPGYEDDVPLLTATPGFRTWARQEIEDFIRAKPYGRRRNIFTPDWMQDQKGHGSCFKAGTLIRMGDGSLKSIDDVKCLNEVLSAEGRVQKVMRTMVRPHVGKMYHLKVLGHRHLSCTAEHPILTKRGYVRADELRKGDMIAMPKYLPNRVESIVPSEYIQATSKAGKKSYAHAGGSYTANLSGKGSVEIRRTPLPELIKLDHRFGRLVGLFLAEGSITSSRVTFHLHEDEATTLAKEIAESFADVFDVKTNVAVNRGTKRTCEVKLYGTGWAKLFEILCSAGSKNKCLHPDLASGPTEFLRGVLEGWQAGDGLGVEDKGGGVTISRKLAMGMFDIANALGYHPTVESLQVKINPKHNIRFRHIRYIVKWPKEDRGPVTHRKWEEDEKTFWRKLDTVETQDYQGYVYNLEVENDHSYVAESIGVHNCNACATAYVERKGQYLRGRLDTPMLNWEFCYAQINGGRDNGSLLKDGMAEAQSTGMPILDLARHKIGAGRIYKNQFTPEEYAAATLNRTTKAVAVNDELTLATAVLSGFAGVVAVHVGSSFQRMDGNGFAGSDSGAGNHAVHVDDVEIVNGELAFDHQGSWGTAMHDQGRAFLSWRRHFATTIKYHQFWVILSTNDGDDPLPK